MPLTCAHLIVRCMPHGKLLSVKKRELTAEAILLSDGYRRLYATCLTMAKQSTSPDARARWLALAKDCENLVVGSGVKGGQSKLPATRLTTRSSVGLRLANVQCDHLFWTFIPPFERQEI